MRWGVVGARRSPTGIRTHAHMFRATFATHMLQRGVDIHTVQELMGHTNIQTTMRYLAVHRRAAGCSGRLVGMTSSRKTSTVPLKPQ